MKQFINRNFTAFAAGSLTLSIASGWMCLSYIQGRQRETRPLPLESSVLGDDSSRIKSRDELRLRAMVEIALQSTWKENLNNAFHAQERFMLPRRNHGTDPKFVQKIDQRCDELMKQQEKREKRRKEQHELRLLDDQKEDTTQFWK
jgi:hypothetical protein